MGTVGLRFNEAAALKASDLDFDRNMISVSRTLSDLNGFIIEQSPKNGKTREVPIPELVRASLLNRKIASGAGGYLWSASNGSALRHSNFNRRVWGPARIASNVTKKFTMHDLRHTSASWLVQYGCSIPQLAKMLGHADPSFTLKRYTHLFDGDMDAISALINRAESA
jgi:integrase